MTLLKWTVSSLFLAMLFATSVMAGSFPQRGSCVQSACNYSGGCSFESDLREYAEACRGVDARCLHTICNHQGCNMHSEVMDTLRSCKDVDVDCLQQACNHGHCTFSLDVLNVTAICRVEPVDGNCLRTVCNYAGDCGFLGAFTEHVKTCRGEWP